jgi:NTE family protein
MIRERPMSIEVDGQTRRVGLALSGGGFRAAAFHLGVFRELQARGMLYKLDLLSCVSGGSIAGAFLASRWGDPFALEDLQTYLLTRSIAVGSVIGGALDPFESRLEKLAKTYDRDLFHGSRMSSLARGPRIYINTTNLSTGNMFFFVAGGGHPTEMGDYELGIVGADNFPLSKAVAASSAFPPVFPPLRLDEHDYKHAEKVGYVTLADGGVYDNMGVNPLLRDRNALDYLIISDAGKPFDIKTDPTTSGALVLKEGLDIMMEQIRGLQFDRVLHRHLAKEGPRPVWFSIDSENGEGRDGDAAFASSIKTNLKALKMAELDVLVRHSQSLLRHRLKTFLGI